MRNYLFAHCPKYECSHLVPICTLESDIKPEFDPHLYVVVVCPNCGTEFRELGSLLEMSRLANPSEKSQS
jgi:hypothetical protein